MCLLLSCKHAGPLAVHHAFFSDPSSTSAAHVHFQVDVLSAEVEALKIIVKSPAASAQVAHLTMATPQRSSLASRFLGGTRMCAIRLVKINFKNYQNLLDQLIGISWHEFHSAIKIYGFCCSCQKGKIYFISFAFLFIAVNRLRHSGSVALTFPIQYHL